MKDEKEYKVIIERYNDQGDGICFVDNKITFVKGAIPGEEVTIRVDVTKKNYAVASIVSIDKTSSNRVVPECKYYDNCGGCQIMHLNYVEQLNFKKNKVMNIMNRYADLKIEDLAIEASSPFNYRNKVTLKVQNGELGYFQARTNSVIAIDTCLIADAKINEIIKRLVKAFKGSENEYEVVIKTGNDGIMLIVNGFEVEASIMQDILDLECGTIFINNDLVKGEKSLIKTVNGIDFNLNKESFFQVNDEIMVKLFAYVKELIAGKKTALDLYSGVGIIASMISGSVDKVIGVELNQSSVAAGVVMLDNNDITNVALINQDVVEYLEDFDNSIDVIVVDPPRKGLESFVVEKIIDLKKPLIYVSCDPMTLARDIKLFSEAGYKVNKIKAFDMFPNTYHVETVVELVL